MGLPQKGVERVTFTYDPGDKTALRAWARAMFGGPARDDEKGKNVVPAEGDNAPTAISDEARTRDYVRRMFNPDYAATEQELP